jgi:heat shock protein HslJ
LKGLDQENKENLMNRRKLSPFIVGLLLILFVLVACGSSQPEAAPALANTEWLLVSLNGESLIPDTSISLAFTEEFLMGAMTCNGYGGTPGTGEYTATEAGTLAMGPTFAVTVQLCSTPEGVMEQEEAYIEALLSAAAYRVVDGRLEIDNGAGETMLIFAGE